MFPITFNAIGDILALAQLLRDIALALDDARGSAAHCQRFAHELRLLGAVIADVHRIAEASLDDALQDATLGEVRLCYEELARAAKLLPDSERLMNMTVGGSLPSRARLAASKLQWRFLKAPDADALALRFHDVYLRLTILIGTFNCRSIEQGVTELSGELHGLSTVAEHEHSFTREEMRRSVARSQTSINESSRMIMDAIQQSHTRNREDASALRRDMVTMSQKLLAATSSQDMAIVERTSDALLDRLSIFPSTNELEHWRFQQFVSSLVPLAAFGAAVVAQSNIDPKWRTTALWTTICALLVHVLRLQSSLPPTVATARDSVIILVDVLGKKIFVDLQLCNSLEHFNGFIDSYFTTQGLPGQDLIQKGAYELYGSDNHQALTSRTWSQYIAPGVRIEMGILLHRAGSDRSAPVLCPWCHTEALEDVSSSLYSCMGCSRSFMATRESGSLNNQSGINGPPLSSRSTLSQRKRSTPRSPLPRQNVDGTSIEQEEDEDLADDVQHFVRIRVIEKFVDFVLQNDTLDGYIPLSFGLEKTIMLYSKYMGSRDSSHIPSGIQRMQDGSYRSGTRLDVALDYRVDQKGIVVPQTMWQPQQAGDVHRHFRDAALNDPIFFFSTDFILGVDLARVYANHPGTPLVILRASAPAPLGNMVTAHFCLGWPGYAQAYRKQVELRDSNRTPITMSKLVERIASFVRRFIEEAGSWPIDPEHAVWRVGRGFISADHLNIIGLVHVSIGCWQPILQLKGSPAQGVI
ncbi:unnamed protein product [Peniophora sp. CBMAI 1063]|nr:unnamed protein product [Peniophora sp. CBMAI 1063]